MCMMSYSAKKLKIIYNKKKILIFVMNMPVISSYEARKSILLMKYAFFALLNEINGIIIPKM